MSILVGGILVPPGKPGFPLPTTVPESRQALSCPPFFECARDAFGRVVSIVLGEKYQVRACWMFTDRVEVMDEPVLFLFACVVPDNALKQLYEFLFGVVRNTVFQNYCLSSL